MTVSVINAAATVLPDLKTTLLASLAPTALGYIKFSYCFTYGYGGAIALTAFLVAGALQHVKSMALIHAYALLFYGVRLNLFLAYRDLFIPGFRDRLKNDKAVTCTSLADRLKRTPMIASVGLLYACMCAPLFVTAKYSADDKVTAALVILTWAAFIFAAAGDVAKSIGKARRGRNALITGGIYRICRHPNYTGEIFAWTASCAAAFSSVLASGGGWKALHDAWKILAASVVGWLGIFFVLVEATTSLERKQYKKYGETKEYQDWVKKSWAGFSMGIKP